jgi:predicted TIM-barrel fold metal-dependent hydrolase
MTRHLVITADAHAGAPAAQYREYLDPQFRDDYDRLVGAAMAGGDLAARQEARQEEQFGGDLFSVDFGGRSGAWDHDVRMRELEELGMVADVVFPDGQNENEAPFHHIEGSSPEQLAAGATAHNRWVADFCALAPERHAGVAMVPLHDIDWAVAETRWARDAGLRGGIFVSPWTGELPFLHHPRYEPLWAVCAETGMPLNFHSAPEHPDYGDHPGSVAIFVSEVAWFSHRPLWFLLWAGVFERYPELQVALVEQSASWVPYTLGYLDSLYERPYFEQLRGGLSMRPSEYWARQVHVSGFIEPGEFAAREQIGVDNLLWGSDYPHIEGIDDPHKNLPEVMGDAPDHEVSKILGENAARLYDFDLDALRPIADRVGPEWG